jgi:5'-deoxynucleotidase YfbR-like HD superfamily hydrolase
MNAEKLVDERKSLLNTFFKECAKYDYIIKSKEFEIFSRGNGEVDKLLNQIPKQKPAEILKKYREVFKVDESVEKDKMEDFKKNSMEMM